jgi:hypothetical protein
MPSIRLFGMLVLLASSCSSAPRLSGRYTDDKWTDGRTLKWTYTLDLLDDGTCHLFGIPDDGGGFNGFSGRWERQEQPEQGAEVVAVFPCVAAASPQWTFTVVSTGERTVLVSSDRLWEFVRAR